MAEYIERKIATNVIGNIDTSHPYVDKDDIVEQAIGLIDHIPAVDVEPVRHGRWVWDEKWDIDVPNHNSTLEYCGWFCSSCGIELGEYMTTSTGEKHYLDDDIHTPSLNYCPNCGAKMDLKGE